MEGSNLSPRVFTELFELFKRQKVEISHAIKTTFPFLEGLRDNNLISSKMYEDFQGSCRALVPVQEVIYKALDELEKKFDMKVLHELFSEVNMEKYPNLKLIHRSFKNVLQNELFFYRSDGGGPNSQLSLGKGPSGSSSQRSLTWLSLDPSSSEGRRNNDRRNSCLIRGNQTETHQLSESPNHLVSSLPEDGLSEDLCENVLIRRVRRDAATNTDKNTKEPERKPASMPRGPGSVPDDIKKEKSSFSLHGNQQTGARINQNEDSEVIELSSDDSDGGDNFPEASTLVPSQPEPTSSRKPPTPRTYRRDTVDVGKNPILGKDGGKRRGKRARLGNYLKRNIKIPMKASWKTDFLARSVNPSWGRKRGWTIPRYDLANFRGTELPVKCGNVEGTLHKEKFKQGIYMKSIKSQTGQWLTPMEFEIEGKREKSKNWRQSIRCKKVTLRELIKIGVLQDPPRKKKETPPNPWQTKRKLGKPKACKVCRKPRKVYPCATCREFYHKNCHIPPVEDKSGPWHCAFCKRKNQLRCQNTQECHKEAEVLKRKMSPEEQLKCELLLLTIYCYPKSGYFIQKPKQRKRDFPDLQEHMWLNKIKNWLNKKTYRSVQCFVEDMRLIFQNHSIFYKGKFKNLGIRVGNKFEKTFKRIFSIEDASNEHPPCKHSSVTLVRSDPSTTNPSSS